MSKYKDIIDNLEKIEFSHYENITSNEKLMIYAAYKLEESGVPLTFNYICIASFKLFPEKFCCDEEFTEFPSVDRLNRTMMHLKYVKQGKPCLTGTPSDGYSMTKWGKASAIEVESIINSHVQTDTHNKKHVAPIVDKHKKGVGEYFRLKETEEYQNYLKTKNIDFMSIWNFFEVIPFTRIKYVKDCLKDLQIYATDKNDQDCVTYIKNIMSNL